MRFLMTCLVLLAASPLGAKDVYRWVDKDGVVHFSDQPMSGAEKIPLKGSPKPGSVTQTYTPSASRPTEGAQPGTSFRYSSCTIANPSQDETFSPTDSIGVGMDLQPGYRVGDRIQVQMNGQRVQDWPETSTSHQFTGLPRGSYSLSAIVMAPDGTTMCTVAPVGFHVLQPSLLSPLRKPAPKG